MNKRKIDKISPKCGHNNHHSKSDQDSSLKNNSRSSTKRFQLKRSDSGLSSDSSDPGLTNHQQSNQSMFEQEQDCMDELCRIDNHKHHSNLLAIKPNDKNIVVCSTTTEPNTKFETTDHLLKENENQIYFMDHPAHSSSNHHHQNYCHHHRADDDCCCFNDLSLSSSTPLDSTCDDNDRILNEFCSTTVVNYENKSFDNDDDGNIDAEMNEDSYQYEIKVADLKRQIEMISRKVLYMEEHIIDLNTENNSLKKQLNNNDELYRKKIKLREDEIESLKETILDLEKFKDKIQIDLKNKEHELCMEKRIHMEDMKLLQQQVTTQEIELVALKKSSERLAELELSYKMAQEQLEAVKISNCAALNELEENYKLKCAEKSIEIGILNAKVDELSHQLIQMQNLNHLCESDQQQPTINSIEYQDNNHKDKDNDNIGDRSLQQQLTQSSLTTSNNIECNHNNPPTIVLTESSLTPLPINNDDIIVNATNIRSISEIDDQTKSISSTDHQRSENFATLNQDNSVTKTKPTPKRKMATISRKWPLKRISSCDIDEDLLNSFNRRTSITSDGVHSSQCGDLMLSPVDNNNNNLKSELASICPGESRAEVFPSLPDVMLRKLCLLRESTCSIESLSEQEIDAKFHTLLLAFKTDKFTLDQRIQLYRHQRDMAEHDAKTELGHLSEYVQELYRLLLGCDSKFFFNTNLTQLKELKDMLDKIDLQVQVINSSVMKISSSSELYGSVKQEERLSTALDVILLHTENLKRSKERDAKELEDVKRLVATSAKNSDMDSPDFDFNHYRRRSGRKSKDHKINPLLMANHLQNVQVSYQQTTSGPSKQYLRTRRLSVPAAEIRNRPKLLQLLSETSVKRLSEELSENYEESKSDDDDNGQQSSKEDSDHEEKDVFQENHNLNEPDNKKLSITPIDMKEQNSHHDDDDVDVRNDSSNGDETNSDNSNYNKSNDNSSQNTRPDSLSDCNNNIIKNENAKAKAYKFYLELVRRLAPFEDKSFFQRINDKLQNVYKTAWLLIIAISNNSRYKLHMVKRLLNNNHNSYENIRYIISGGLVFTSIIILIWSIILPIFSA